MSVWKGMENELTTWLGKYKKHGLKYCNPHESIPGMRLDGLLTNSFCSDGLLTKDNSLLALEVEAGQPHADTNVGKYWLLSEPNSYKQIVLVHVFTPDFNSYPWYKHLGGFYAAKMQEEMPYFSYVPIQFPTGKSYARAVEEVRRTLREYIRQLFNVPAG